MVVARLLSFILIATLVMAALTDEERKERAQKAALKKQQMESCLTLVRSFYSKEEAMIKQFVDVHPTQDKGRLTSKFLSRMMLKCGKEITPAQVTQLQNYKNSPLDLDYTKDEDLIMIDWEEMRYQGDSNEPEASRPVEMSPEESIMSNDVEELSEDMRRETESETRKAMGKTTLAFIDLENMSATVKTACILFASILFGGIGYFFYLGLFAKEDDPIRAKREKLNARRAAVTKKQD